MYATLQACLDSLLVVVEVALLSCATMTKEYDARKRPEGLSFVGFNARTLGARRPRLLCLSKLSCVHFGTRFSVVYYVCFSDHTREMFCINLN